MTKKVIFIIIALLVVSAVSSFAFGIGGAFSFNPVGTTPYYGGAMTMSFGEDNYIGVLFAINENDIFSVGHYADFWLVNQSIGGPLNFFFGLGPYVIMEMGDIVNFDAGLRVPVGLNAYVAAPLELFFEIAPAIGVGFGSEWVFPAWSIQSAAGLRIWF